MAYDRRYDILRLLDNPTGDDEILAVDRTGSDGEAVRVRFADVLARTAYAPAFASYPGLYNVKPSNLKKWRKALAGVRAGTGQARLLTVGDSTNFGQGAGTGASGTIGARVKSYPAFLVKLLNGMGIPASFDTFTGNGGLTDVDYLAYDPRITLGAGWAQQALTVLATRPFSNSTTTNPMTVNLVGAFDQVEIGYLQNTGYGTFTVGVDGGAALATINAAGAQAIMKTVVTVPQGVHALNIARTTGGAVSIAYIVCYSTQTPSVCVFNAGWTGAAVSSFDSVASAWSPGNTLPFLAPDLSIINLGINNWRATPVVDLATFKTQYQNTITRLKAVGDVILIGPAPSDTGSADPDNQAAYMAAIYDLAAVNDLPLIDITQRFVSRADANGLGFYFDTLHPSSIGYADMAQLVAKALQI